MTGRAGQARTAGTRKPAARKATARKAATRRPARPEPQVRFTKAVAKDAWDLTMARAMRLCLAVSCLVILRCASSVRLHHDVAVSYAGIALGLTGALLAAVALARQPSRRRCTRTRGFPGCRTLPKAQTRAEAVRRLGAGRRR